MSGFENKFKPVDFSYFNDCEFTFSLFFLIFFFQKSEIGVKMSSKLLLAMKTNKNHILLKPYLNSSLFHLCDPVDFLTSNMNFLFSVD